MSTSTSDFVNDGGVRRGVSREEGDGVCLGEFAGYGCALVEVVRLGLEDGFREKGGRWDSRYTYGAGANAGYDCEGFCGCHFGYYIWDMIRVQISRE